jgi:RNA recognition motif-containing protein
MSTPQEKYESSIVVDEKEIFVDVKQNNYGIYLKISEKSRRSRSAVVIGLSGAADFQKAITRAIQAASKMTPGPVVARPPRQPRVAVDPAVASLSVHVGGLAWETTEAALAAHFRKAGTVQKATLNTRVRDGEVVSKGSGVVEFKNAADVQRAIETLNDTELDGRVIRVEERRSSGDGEKRKRAPRSKKPRSEGDAPREPREPRERAPRPPREPRDMSNLVVDPRKVYVTSLAWSTTTDELSNVFSAVGDVVNCEMVPRRDGRASGVAVVEFSNSREATEAIERLNGKMIDGREISARVCYIK